MKIKIIKENFSKAMKEFAEVPGGQGGRESGPDFLKQKVLGLFKKVGIQGSSPEGQPEMSLWSLLEKYRWEDSKRSSERGMGRTSGNADLVADAIVELIIELLGGQAQDQSPEPPETI